MALSDTQMDKFEAHVKTKSKHLCPMCGGRKFEFVYETLVLWKVDATGAANIVDPDRGKILTFIECMECNYYMFFNPQKMGIMDFTQYSTKFIIVIILLIILPAIICFLSLIFPNLTLCPFKDVNLLQSCSPTLSGIPP
jgi:hypothetical protein